MNPFYLQIQEASGETRHVEIKTDRLPLFLGNTQSSGVKIASLPPGVEGGCLSLQNDRLRFTLNQNQDNVSPRCRAGDLDLNDFFVPLDQPFALADARLTFSLNQKTTNVYLPPFPQNTQPWLTASPSGAKTLFECFNAAKTPLSIYLQGETGTGKDILARAIHAWSNQAGQAFVAVNCGALSISLAESELFGHVKGAFTGASSARPGALLRAHNGTLFLDEVGDLPLELQVKLLRFLENGEIQPLGSDQVSHAQVRVICATHKPLAELVQKKRFREDLYFRLTSIPIQISPLRSRPQDIELIAKTQAKQAKKQLSTTLLHHLKRHSWPGNVRQLKHSIERASAMKPEHESLLQVQDFEFLYDAVRDGERAVLPPQFDDLNFAQMERLILLDVLRKTNGNRSHAAKTLGLARSTVFQMLKRHKISGPKTPWKPHQNSVH